MNRNDSTNKRAPSVLDLARAYVAGGLSVVAVPPDGSKRPRVPWRRFQLRPPHDALLVAWFASGCDGVAILCGQVSGGLEVLDFDEAALFAPWVALVEAHAPGLIARLPVVRSPGPGWHVYLRCPGHAAGNQKLALGPGSGGRPVTLIETRGEGGLVLTPACPPGCHPSDRPYLLEQGDLAHVPVVTPEERGLLLDAARSFTRHVPPRCLVVGLPAASRPRSGSAPLAVPVSGSRRRPGDRFNAESDWPAILEPHGWRCIHRDGEGLGHWRRPGKSGPGWSATTDYAGAGLLYVFSSNAAPFEPGRGYTKFAVHALLDFGGNFRAAARALTVQRAGQPSRSATDISVHPWPGDLVRGCDGTLVRRLPPPERPVGVLLPAPSRSGAAPVVLERPASSRPAERAATARGTDDRGDPA